MKIVFPICLVISSLYYMPALAAKQAYKCIEANGSIVFSDMVCPAQTQQSTHTLRQPQRIPAPSQQRMRPTTPHNNTQQRKTRVTVVGEPAQPCGISDSYERRTAMVRKQVRSGMNQAEIESMYGKPIKSDINNGTLTATYRSAKGQKRSVRFDEHGCVRLSNKRQPARSGTSHSTQPKK